MFRRTGVSGHKSDPLPTSWCVWRGEQRPRLHSRRSSGSERCSGKEPGQVEGLWLGIPCESSLLEPEIPSQLPADVLREEEFLISRQGMKANPSNHPSDSDRSKLLSTGLQVRNRAAKPESCQDLRLAGTLQTQTPEHNPAAFERLLCNGSNAPLNGHNAAHPKSNSELLDVRGGQEKPQHFPALSTPPELPELSRSYERSALTCVQQISEEAKENFSHSQLVC